MAVEQLIHRLAGVTAICVVPLLAPISPVARFLAFIAFLVGVALEPYITVSGRWATRIVGVSALLLVLVPSFTAGALVSLVALASIGVASTHPDGLSRAVPALGLPVMAAALRTGEAIPAKPLMAWAVLVVLTMVLGVRANSVRSGPRLGHGRIDSGGVGGGGTGRWSWQWPAQAFAVALIIAPTALVLASTAVGVQTAVKTSPAAEEDEGPGATLAAHPGLSGGLDAGAPVSLSDEIVLRVKTDRPMYWRGTTYDHWDGRRWSSNVEHQTIGLSEAGLSLPVAAPGDSQAPASTAMTLPEPVAVVQQFEVERAGLDVLLGAWQPTALWVAEHPATLGDDGTVLLGEPLEAGATWSVQSDIVPVTADDLRLADPKDLSPESEIMVRFGTEDAVSPEVAELALAITAEAPTTYDKITAIEDWMDANLAYTRSIPVLAPGDDAVDHLLFESRQGFCEQIGSAMVVMARSLGIPARIVVGYVPSEYDDSTGTWISRGTDAHAWAEVYFPGVGWQGFDPTAGVPLTAAQLPDRATPAWLLALSLAVGLAVVGGLVVRLLPTIRRDQDEPVGCVVDLQRRLEHCGSALGCEWTAATTIREKGAELVAAGIDNEPVGRAVVALEKLWCPGSGPPRLNEEQLLSVVADMDEIERLVELVRHRGPDPERIRLSVLVG